MECTDARALLHAHADGELGAADSLRLDQHLAGCPACAAELAQVRALQAAVRQGAAYHRASPALRARLIAALPGGTPDATAPIVDTATKRSPRWLRWFDWPPAATAALAGLTAVTLGLGVAQFAWRESPQQALTREVVDSHVRGLVSGHAIDVASSDRHTVKPWFNGRLDYAPPVFDLSAQGFPLAGGRLDYVDGRRVAVLVYRRNQHPVDVFVLPGKASGEDMENHSVTWERHGYQVARWQSGGMRVWAVTDASAADLRAFGAAWRAAAAGTP